MSVTSGFFNSLNGDRKYNAEQMSSIFDGIINDGVFSNIGTAFMVNASTGNEITVGIGRAWFNSTWIYNDAILPITAEDSDLLLNRYDAVVIEVDRSDSVRAASIKIITGTAETTPIEPTMVNTQDIHQYPLAYIYRPANSSEIDQADITYVVGSSATPLVTGILKTLDLDNLTAQMAATWNRWFFDATDGYIVQWDEWYAAQQAEYDAWYATIVGALGEDAAATLAAHIVDTNNPHGLTAAILKAIENLNDERHGILVENGAIYLVNVDTGAKTKIPLDNDAVSIKGSVSDNGYESVDGIINVGIYAVAGTAAGLPSEASPYGILCVYRSGGYCIQMYQSTNTNDNNAIWQRATADGTTWLDWIKLGDQNGYLSLAGGRMKGPIVSVNDILAHKPDTASMLLLRAGANFDDGASFALYGKDYADEALRGVFELYANAGSGARKFKGMADGTLLWGGDAIYGEHNKPAPADIGAAAASHTHPASKVTSGTFPSTAMYAKTGTDYTTYRIRNIAANTSSMTASSTALANGNIYLQYS